MDCEEVKIPVPWGSLAGKWWGSKDQQPILLFHGWQDNAGSFDPLIPLLPQNLSYLSIDLPGHGFSSHLPPGSFYYNSWDGVITVRRIVKHYKWKKVSIIGHSMGGGIGFMYAAAFPDEVDKLVSLDTAYPRYAYPKTIVDKLPWSIDTFLKYEGFSPSNQPCYDPDDMFQIAEAGYRGSVNPEGVEVMMKRGLKPSPHSFEKYLFCRDIRLTVTHMALPSVDILMEFAEKVKCNYLNIRAVPERLGRENPGLYGLILRILNRTCKTFQYHEVEGTHHVHLNEPSKVAGHISNFLLDLSSEPNDPLPESCDVSKEGSS